MSGEHSTWEYTIEIDATPERLNDLGRAGWELVSVEHRTCYFKRARLSFKERVTLDQKRRYYATWGRPEIEEAAAR